MFRHQGKARTLSHNLKIASLLSFVAGIVNVCGFLSIQRLTTNVTGHFAFFVDEVFKLNFWQGGIYFLYIFFFFFGSFTSGILTELTARKNERLLYVAPVFVECIILISIGAAYENLPAKYADIFACCLLFAMGLQNSLVTALSNSAVRTTHLTGLFTDLGIELSQTFFYKYGEHRHKIYSSVKLRLRIISFFFLGGISGGFLYVRMNLHALLIPGLLILAGLIYDNVKLKVIQMKRKFRNIDAKGL